MPCCCRWLRWRSRKRPLLVREAKVLLHHTAMSVAEVAEKLGLATPSFFIRFFRQQTGQTPLQYRKASSTKTDSSATKSF
ncbi:MAG: helix-turn-helix transcriptional regulator [Bacteroidales bacterium]|nr:helix-turn-helix transcriptional regulator [Bacteroidales bacterium]